MPENSEPIRSIVARLSTDKPVRKTPYQVKGVIMHDFPAEPIVPLIDGSYREQFLYPRVQVKILNEQIYLVGIKEGVEPVESILDMLKTLNFGNITFEVQDFDAEIENDRFMPTSRMIRYKFLTPWIALNETNLMKYKYMYGEERLKLLIRLLSQNIVFLAKEMGLQLQTKIFSKLKLESLYPKLVDDGQMGSFQGEFRCNFILPNFLGIGNGITKGYGVLFSHFNPADFTFDESELEKKSHNEQDVEDLPENWEEEAIAPDDIPRSRRGAGESKKDEPNYNALEYHKRKH
ncbi:MAG: CRISPR-associated endonuclease Cas6 [Candidatus Neomarinimicrobiota bacterium]